MPIYSHSFYKKFKFNKKYFLNSEKYYKEAISIPIYFGLSKKNHTIPKAKNPNIVPNIASI